MNKQSLFFTCIVAIASLIIMFFLINLFYKKRFQVKEETPISNTYLVWIGSLLGTFFLLLKVALEQIENTIEIVIYSPTINNTFFVVMQKIFIFTGFTYFFSFLLYFIVDFTISLTNGMKKEQIEMEQNNTNYFLLKAFLMLALAYSLLDVFEHFLKWFIPVIDTPFYH
ncbi:MAG: hypothetical protein ABNG98_03880 [Flavobacterium sp.]|jgi:hypothetical protein